jgi:hypothetical protein
MLHEFKRPMWNDGYSKEQPWLNYFNSYERMHCCFDGDGGGDDDGGGYGEDTGMTAAQAADVAAAMDAAQAAEASTEGQQAAGDVAAADIQGIDVSEVDAGMSRADASIADIETLEDLGLIGYNDKQSLGYFDKAEAEDYARSQAEAAALQDSYTAKGKDVGITVGRDGTYSYTGKDAGTVGLSEMGKGLSYAMASTGIGGLVSGIARTLGITAEEVTKEDIQTYGGLREEGISSQQEKDSKGIAGPSYGGAALGGNLAELQEGYAQEAFDLGYGPSSLGYGGAALGGMTDAELQEAFAQEAFDLGIGPSSPGYGGAALGGMTDAELQAGYAQEARDMSYAEQQNEDETFGEDETDEGVQDTGTDTSIPILEPEEKEPETAMEAYFRKLGIATPAPPAAPSFFQQYPSYLPPIGPADNAAYRRKLALGTPRYQEPSGPNPSISTLAAVYGLTYEEAAKKFAFPSVPAASGGGLNSLMRYK